MALGLNVPEPETSCGDENCPFHGTLAVRGQTFDGLVASTDMDKTVVVEREYDVGVPKYDRFMKRRSRVPAHHPPCLDLAVGDTVRLAETRPLSKTKSHVIVARLSGGGDGEGVGESESESQSASESEGGADVPTERGEV